MDVAKRTRGFDSNCSPEEERRLWADFRAEPEGSAPRIRLVELYLPLVAKAANSMPQAVRQRVSFQELVSSGVIGLHDAISAYRDGGDASFSTFAFKRIKGAILDDLRSLDHLTRTQRSAYKDVCAAIGELTQQLSRPPTDAEIAVKTGLAESEIDRIIGMGGDMVNLNDEFEDGLRYVDVLADSNTPSPEESVNKVLALEKVKSHFLELDEREQKILFLRHFQDLSVKEIAVAMELSEGRISQIYYKTVLKLRALMKI
jgi:RNA polymerase sigma factor FliA